MRSHLATKRLSAYLDDELPDRELRQVEAHVSECPACQSRLHGLRLVVSNLQRMPAASPPPYSARSIEVEAALRWGPPPGKQRLFGQRGLELLRDLIQLSAVAAGALAIIATLAAWNAARDRGEDPSLAEPTSRERGSSAGPSEAASTDRAVVNGKSYVYRDGWWQEEMPPPADLVGPPAPGFATAGE